MSTLLTAILAGSVASADDAAGWGDLGNIQQKTFDTKVYGFIDSYVEKVAKTPAGVDESGKTVLEENPYEFDVLNLNLMIQGSVHAKYRYFLNFAAPGAGSNADDEGLSVRNAWVELPLAGNYLQVRAGKLYRRFGLYNEILDAVPTFIGIEPPELFDKDHLMLTRTTNLMVFGSIPFGANTLHYSVATGNDERADKGIPVGADAYVDFGGVVRLGSSFYTTGGLAGPSRGVGDDSPRGGVINWMAEDRYTVYGGYGQVTPGNLITQFEFWRADHDAVRDEEAVLSLADAGLNPRQMSRFFTNGDPAEGVSNLAVQYAVQTAYVRAGYQIPIGDRASITPYLQGDFYSNPETINDKDFGGDAEAGQSDDGMFLKYTAGAVVRPVPQVALKVDGSAHQLEFNGETIRYPEVRLSLSYLWQLQD